MAAGYLGHYWGEEGVVYKITLYTFPLLNENLIEGDAFTQNEIATLCLKTSFGKFKTQFCYRIQKSPILPK